MALEMEIFYPLEKPKVGFFGAAANASRQFVNVVELIASRYHFLVVIELPEVKCYDGEVDWTVNHQSEVTIEGQIDAGEIFSDVSFGLKRRRVQLCPSEPWGISFYLPGPVEWWTASILFTSSTVMELTVRRAIPLAELTRTLTAPDTIRAVNTSRGANTSRAASTSAAASTSRAASTSAAANTSTLDDSTGVSSPGVTDIDEMIAGWLL